MACSGCQKRRELFKVKIAAQKAELVKKNILRDKLSNELKIDNLTKDQFQKRQQEIKKKIDG